MADFKPSQQVAHSMVKAYQTTNIERMVIGATPTEMALAENATLTERPLSSRPDINSKHLPELTSHIDTDQVQNTLSERLMRFLGTFRYRLADRPDLKSTVLVTHDDHFVSEFRAELIVRLNLESDTSQPVVDGLAHDLKDWIASDTVAAQKMGLVRADDGTVLISPLRAKTVLTPLE